MLRLQRLHRPVPAAPLVVLLGMMMHSPPRLQFRLQAPVPAAPLVLVLAPLPVHVLLSLVWVQTSY